MFIKRISIASAVFGLLLIQLCQSGFADTKEQFKQADSYIKSWNYQKAETIYKDIIKQYPGTNDDLKARSLLAGVYVLYNSHGRVMDINTVITDMTNNFRNNTKLPEALSVVARKYASVKKYKEAKELYRQITGYDPNSNSAITATMNIIKDDIFSYIDSNSYTEAQSSLDRLNSTYAERNNMPLILYSVGRRFEHVGMEKCSTTKGIYQQIIQQYPNSTYTGKARVDAAKTDILILINSGKYDEAQAGVGRLIADFNSNTELPRVLFEIAGKFEASCKKEQGERPSREIYRKIAADYANSPFGMKAKAKLFHIVISSDNDIDSHEADLNKFIADFGTRTGFTEELFYFGEQYCNHGLGLERHGKKQLSVKYLEKAASLWDKVANSYPDSALAAKAATCVADSCYRVGQYDKAAEYCKKVIQTWPDFEFVWHCQHLLGLCYESQRNSGAIPKSTANPMIEQAYKYVADVYPNCSHAGMVCMKLGSFYYASRQWPDAIKYYEQFLRTANIGNPAIAEVKAKLEEIRKIGNI